MSVAASGFDPAWLARSALLIVDMNRSHLDHSIGYLLVASRMRIASLPVPYACARHGLPPAAR